MTPQQLADLQEWPAARQSALEAVRGGWLVRVSVEGRALGWSSGVSGEGVGFRSHFGALLTEKEAFEFQCRFQFFNDFSNW